MRRPTTAFLAASMVAGLVAVLCSLAPGAQASGWTESSYTSKLVSLVNQTRSQHGLGGLTIASGTTQVAAAWNAHMASTGSLAHNPDLRHQLETHGSADWTTYGENVGDGPNDNPDALFKAYMNSPEHRDNILNGAYRYIGVSTVFAGDTAWNTFDFVDVYHSSSSTSQPTTSKPKPKPKPTHTTSIRPVTKPTAPTVRTTATTVTPAPTPSVVQPSHAPAKRLHHSSRKSRVQGREVARQPLAERQISLGARTPVVALADLPLPAPLTVPAELAICVAAGMIGYIAVRWAQVCVGSPRAA